MKIRSIEVNFMLSKKIEIQLQTDLKDKHCNFKVMIRLPFLDINLQMNIISALMMSLEDLLGGQSQKAKKFYFETQNPGDKCS